jgi:hypothetical protein
VCIRTVTATRTNTLIDALGCRSPSNNVHGSVVATSLLHTALFLTCTISTTHTVHYQAYQADADQRFAAAKTALTESSKRRMLAIETGTTPGTPGEELAA